MKILLGIVFICTTSYVPTLWSYRSEDHEKPDKDKIVFIDMPTKTEKSNIIITSTTTETTTVKDSVTEMTNISIRNVSENSTITNEGNSTNMTILDNAYDIVSRTHYYQLSDIVKKNLTGYNCTERSERSSLPESCEKYIECKNGEATSLQCLDGLHFDPENSDSEIPCQYSCDVPCANKTIQLIHQSRECPYKFGYFKLEDEYNCSSFRICEFGFGYDFKCPNGLAFRSDILRCDWPHKVPECDAEGYAGFQCPDKKQSYQFYRSPTTCEDYYICIYGVPRRQVCPNFMGFDEDSHACAPADRVHECHPRLKILAKENRRKQFLENINKENYDDGDGYLVYVPTLWSYRSDDHEKPDKNKIVFIDMPTKTEKSNIIITSTTTETTTVKDSVTETTNISIRNVSEKSAITDEGNSINNMTILDSTYVFESRAFYYQLSEVIEKNLTGYNCTERSERSSLPESCEAYIECKNGEPRSLQCLDGLHFDPENADGEMPCQYSCDVPCSHKPSKSNSHECPHKFGYFKLKDKFNCSSFRICEFGFGYDFECPNGLAFRSDILRCDWPHKVPECDAEGYAGFQCPDKEDSVQLYGSPASCQVYYICIYGVPRRLICPNFMGFDEDSNACAPADSVDKCDPHLKSAAIADRKKQYFENEQEDKEDYDDGDGYLANRHTELSFAKRVRRPKIISYPYYEKGFKKP